MLIDNHILITLAMGILAIFGIKILSDKTIIFKKRAGFLVLGVISCGIGFCLEWGAILIPFMLVMYFWRDRKVLMLAGFILIQIIALVIPLANRFSLLHFPLFSYITASGARKVPWQNISFMCFIRFIYGLYTALN